MNRLNLFVVIVILFSSCKKVAPPEPVLPIPSERQIAWHKMEFYAFVHFNMNTFTNMEWGLGDESPEMFNPTGLDCRQWARVCKEAGMKGIILTAKHHDGFCLWPSAYTGHSVKNSPWKNGGGDVVKELSEACKEYGLKMGVYLSPWDRNHADYGKPGYITYFRNQLRELLTNYGDIYEVWFDGANGGTGWYGGANEERRIDRTTYYDWENTRKIVRELQPNACMFSDAGPDVRWVGNEQGWAGETNWSILKRDDFAPGVVSDLKFLQQGQIDGTHWLPAEVDVSIRPGWYYHPSEDHKVKTLPQLLDIYYNSIGRNASFLLNLPVDKRGLVNEEDVRQLKKLSGAIKADFANNLAAGKKASASNFRGNSKKYKPGNVVDGNPETYWATDDNVVASSITIDLGGDTEFNRFLVQEYIPLGQRVKKFALEALVNGEWKQLDTQTTIGYKRILRFPNVLASKIRLDIKDAKASPVISNIEIYKAPKVLLAPQVMRNKAGIVSMKSFDTGLDIYYTVDGSVPSNKSGHYTSPFKLDGKVQLKAIAYDPAGEKASPVATFNFDISKAKWKLMGNFENEKKAELIFDGDPQTAWSLPNAKQADYIIDLGEVHKIKGFTYLPDQSRHNAGIIFNYELYISIDGKNWGLPVSKGEFSNIKNSPVLQERSFDAVNGRFLRFRALPFLCGFSFPGISEFSLATV